jgi:hypothetical protein
MNLFSHLTVADWITVVGLLVTLELGIVNGTIKLTNAIPDAWVPRVQAWCGILAAIGGGIITALSRMVGAVVFCIALSMLLAGNPAMAQTGNIVKDIAAARARVGTVAPKSVAVATPAPAASSTDALSKLMADLAKVEQNVVTGVIADINAADADAGTIITPAVAATDTTPAVPAVVKDPIAHACYPAEVQFLQSLPVATAPTGTYVLVQLFQKKRDFIMQIQSGLPAYLRLGCAALLGDEIQTFTKSMALIGVTVAANSLLPGSGGLALPALPALAL